MRQLAQLPPRSAPPAEETRAPSQLQRRAGVAFDSDFSGVSVSTGRSLGGAGTLAAAFGNQVLLDRRLDAEPPAVRDLVFAHELAHVAQQQRALRTDGAKHASIDPETLQAHEQAHLEANANAAALKLLSGERASIAPAPLALSRCARPAGTFITPAHFRFQTVVPIRPGDSAPAGWQAAVIRAQMSKDVGGAPYGATTCLFEVGVPIRNYLGDVSVLQAQTASATAANSAAYTVLSSGEPVTAATCILFRRLMQAELQELIPGARVSSPVSRGLPVVDFP